MGQTRAPRLGRTRALLAGGLVLGVGAATTLAAWTDTEWVWGGNGSGEPLAASTFEVQQNVWDGASGAANFTDRETAPGGELNFTVEATELTPGDSVYAPMQLRTTANSDPAAVTLTGATLGSGDQAFFAALRYEVRVDVPKAMCAAAAFAGTGDVLVAADSPLTTGSAPDAIQLVGDGANAAAGAVDLCFRVTLPAGSPDTLQGLGAAPQWAFESISQ